MKNVIRLILVVTIVLSLFATTASASGTYYVTGDGVRVRSEPKNADNVIDKLHYGDQVEVVAQKGGWCYIKYTKKGTERTGYITETFITEKGTEVEKGGTLGLTRSSVKMVNSKGHKIATIPKHTVIEVVASKKGWSMVKYGGKQGFVKTSTLWTKEAKGMKCIGCYTISYSFNDSGRTDNIKRATKRLNGCTVKPGGKFSFLNAVAGSYDEATEFGEDDVSYGGGLSQVATTLSKAVNDAQRNGCNIKVTEKHRHSKKTAYAKKGEEAMVDLSTGQDFVFTNKSKYTIKIYALAIEDSVVVLIFRK